MIQTPAEEVLGGMLSKIPGISKIAARAPREGGINATADAKAIARFWQADSFRGMLEQLQSGRDLLDMLYGHKKIDKEFLNLPGRAHGALKEIPKRAEFFRAFEKRLAYEGRQGRDTSDPRIQMSVAMESYNDAMRSIFMQPNAISSWFSRSMNDLATRGTRGKIVSALVRIEFPITRVPVNYVAEQSSLITPVGVLKGLGKVAEVGYKSARFEGQGRIQSVLSALKGDGAAKLTPDEADYVLRAWKKAGVGLGFMAWGYLRPQTFGGYYQKGDKRDPNDPKAGEMMIAGHRIPRWATHIPLLEAAQFGATIHRVQDAMLKKGVSKSEAATEGTLQAGAGLASEVPFVSQPQRLADIFSAPNKRKALTTFFGGEARGFIPGAVQQIATSTDTIPSGDTRKRRPQTFSEQVKMGLPIVRKSVPISDVFGRQATKGSDEAQRLNVDVRGAMRQPNETPADFADRQKVANKAIRDSINQTVNSTFLFNGKQVHYDNLPDEEKAYQIKQAKKDAVDELDLPEKPEKPEEKHGERVIANPFRPPQRRNIFAPMR